MVNLHLNKNQNECIENLDEFQSIKPNIIKDIAPHFNLINVPLFYIILIQINK